MSRYERWPPRDFRLVWKPWVQRELEAAPGPGPRARRLREVRFRHGLDIRGDLAPQSRYPERVWRELEDGSIVPVSDDIWDYFEGVLDVACFGRPEQECPWMHLY